ncbi:homocysteine S-methyltransferase family protein [Clostridium boliviensis]|uniref:Methionine synthase n=1 Tax=Clostridium boliviensis TaxID=318465 RepID=A0ABU4GND7_9CLOT|nr:homocysteine S-methyltransferase family protein [Clostridium boliviensis]MDW2799099.1 homocysteine S-methyltransferase family protein [Clostridium boliviensis]
MTAILEELKNRILFFDGGMGSLLQASGLIPGELPETWNITHSDLIVKIHRDYLEAGADLIKTNTFGANGLKFNQNKEFDLEQIVTAAMRNAKQAVDTAVYPEGRKKGAVALDIGPTGKLLKPLGDLDFEEAYELFSQIVRIGVREGADLILIETMSDSYEAKAAVLAAKENSSLPVFVTMIFDEKGKLLTGGNVESTVALLEGLGVDALGTNCGLGPVQMKGILEDIMKVVSVPVIVNPNAGLPRSEGGKTVYDIDEDQFARAMKAITEAGACIIGGCCGTTPEHIKKMVAVCKDYPVRIPEKKHRTVISSYAQAVVIDRKPVIIGERINPTGKSKFKQALKDHNLEYILKEGVLQQDNGAHVLDVNVGLPEIDEPSMMEEVVKELQSIIDLPLQIDTSNMAAMERAMRIYNGKPLINSVNGKKEAMDAIFPLVKRYGGVVVALALDEDGIPETVEGRIAVSKKIYDTAAGYGIGKEDIIIDALCMTVSSDSKGALTTLETVRRVRDELEGKTILGVSNISFGLPQREIVNAAFFTMALQNGLNAAIINPNSEAMMRSYYSYCVLADLDPQCSTYISTYSGNVTVPGETKGESRNGLSLQESIKKGLKDRAFSAVTELLEHSEPLMIIQEEMIPALNEVGKGFEKGTVFLPQLLMSAEAAKAAFEVIKERLAQSGAEEKRKGTVILATVKGDIHDIGKNIVKVLLENYSYEVIDLGKDVAPETIVKTAADRDVKLVGLSALMTTTVPSMEETIRQLREKVPFVNVMVGGAVLTKEYAMTIGADRYCRDAMASVNYAEEIFEVK